MKAEIRKLFREYYLDEAMPIRELEDKILALFDHRESVTTTSKSNNDFLNDEERILELRTCLQEVLGILCKADPEMIRTLIQDVLSRYDEGKKFLTASVSREGVFEFLND